MSPKAQIFGACRRRAADAESVQTSDSGRSNKLEGRGAGAGSSRRFAAADHINRCWTYILWTTARWRATESDDAFRSHLRGFRKAMIVQIALAQPANGNRRQCCEFLPPNTLRLSRAALLGADRTAARQPPRRTQTRPERTAAGVTPVQVGTNRGRPGGRANERGRVGL